MNTLNDYIKIISSLKIPKTIKKIKVSPKLYNLIRALFDREVIYGINFPPDTAAMWRGIAIEVDCDKEDFAYEAVYEEDNNNE